MVEKRIVIQDPIIGGNSMLYERTGLDMIIDNEKVRFQTVARYSVAVALTITRGEALKIAAAIFDAYPLDALGNI